MIPDRLNRIKRDVVGVTVLEVILAFGILAVALLSLMAVFASGLRTAQASDQMTAASTVGQEFLELVRARGYAVTAVGAYDGRQGDAPDAATGFPFAPYPVTKIDRNTYTLVVTCTDQTPTLRSVKVEVYWNLERQGKLTFYTMIHV